MCSYLLSHRPFQPFSSGVESWVLRTPCLGMYSHALATFRP
jgi:hypothetical protein